MTNVWIKNPTNNEVFTFADGMIRSTSDTFELEVDQNKMPGAGPMFNQGFDASGIGKTVSIPFTLFDTSSSVTKIGGSVVNDIRSKKLMKYWLEALNPGFTLSPVEFYVPFADKATESVGDSPFTDSVSGASVTIKAKFVPIKGRIIALSFTEEEGNPDKYEGNITFWICGF